MGFFSFLLSLQKIIKEHKLREKGHAQHQTYALGIKEVSDHSYTIQQIFQFRLGPLSV